jgi:DNA-binding response OmpR family regulator
MTEGAPTRLLLVDDEPSLREPLAEYLTRQGFVVRQAEDAAKARSALLEETPDLVLLDIMMPGEDGLSLCRHLSESKHLPVIMLTAKNEAMDRIVGLEIGADDYLPKPFEMEELLARLRALIRRSSGEPAPILSAGPLKLDTRQMRFTLNGLPVALSPLEYRLLAFLMHRAGRIVPPTELADHLYDTGHDRDPNAIEVIVARLRRKLGAGVIETRRGFGYLLPLGVK